MSIDALDVQVDVDIQQIRRDIQRGIRECTERGLTQSVKWLAELNYSLRHYKIETEDISTTLSEKEKEEEEAYVIAKSFFDCQEYDRAAYFLENCVSSKCSFLKMYSKYLSSEKKRLDNMQDSTDYSSETCKSKVLRELLNTLKSNKESLDGYSLYLYGLILKKLELRHQAVEALEEAVQVVPWFWGAWRELATLVSDREMMDSLRLPSLWITYFFMGQVYTELKLSEQALEVYNILKCLGFDKCTYVSAQIAVAHHDRRDVDSALELFKEVYHQDPYRLDYWDVYSHLLYVMEKKSELASLAHQAVEIDKYRVQTCCVIGNYYSLRSEHHKAVVYFQRALVLNPQYLVAWILMGHEFIELQNSNAAIQCYRQAIEVNRNDYRAWNGLGQAYEITGLHGYCVYYYAKAAQLRPSDSRMLVSLGEAFEKLEKIPNALKCYYRAHSAGDIEGMALFRLGKLYDKLVMSNSAAAAYAAACADGAPQSCELPTALRYLAHYHLKRDEVDHAAYYAYKCLQHEETKEEGKALLKAVAEKRATSSAAPVIKPPSNLDVTPDCRHTPLGERQAFLQNYSTPSVLQPSPVNSRDCSRYKI